MLWLLLDAAVIIGLVNFFHEGESPGWGTAFGTAIALSLGFYLCFRFLGESLGLFSMVPMAAAAGVLLWVACDVPIKKAMIAGGVLLVYKVGMIFLMVALVS